ncbi:MAG: VanZ family protein [Clostridia bacterium]|nr:VanZ family protein [Clostridia bacterium]
MNSLSKKRKVFIAIISVVLLLTLVFVWGNSLKPRAQSSSQSGGLYLTFQKIIESIFGESFATKFFSHYTEFDFRKTAHIFEYTLIGLEVNLLYLAIFTLKPLNSVYSFGAGLFVAVVDETIQKIVGRNGTVSDVLLDLIPVIIISALFLLVWFIKNKKNKNGSLTANQKGEKI